VRAIWQDSGDLEAVAGLRRLLRGLISPQDNHEVAALPGASAPGIGKRLDGHEAKLIDNPERDLSRFEAGVVKAYVVVLVE